MYVTTQDHAQQLSQFINYSIMTLVTEPVMNKMSPSVTPSGILGVFEIPKNPPLTSLSDGIVLAHIADPGNMGTLIRTAAAMNVSSVVIVDGVDPYSPKVIQASAGCLALVNLFCIDWKTLVHGAKQAQLTLVALVVTGGQNPEKISLKKSLLVVGSEAYGIPGEWLKDCNQAMTLPMPGKTESLNAAIAGSIALYLAYTK